jgi:hypothetical protein
MTTNEVLTIIISSAALLVALTTLYFTFFHKWLGLIVCLAAYKTESENDPMCGNYEFSLSNTGNRELLVREAFLDLEGATGDSLVPEVSNSLLPVVMKPGQMLLMSFDIPNLFMRNVANSGNKVIFRFHVFSPEGKAYLPSTTIEIINEELEIHTNGWKPFKLGHPEK